MLGDNIIALAALPREPTTLDEIRKLKRDVRLTLKSDDNYLYPLVSLKHYNIIINLTHSTKARIFLLITMIIWAVLVGTKIEILWTAYIILICLFFWIPFCIFYLLSVNRTAFKNIVQSFDFWIKVIYMFIWGLFDIIHRFILQNNRFDHPSVAFFAYLCFDIVCVMGLIIISSFDGFKIKEFWTVLISAFFAVTAIFISVFYQFEKVSVGDDSTITFNEYSLSLRTIIINSQRTVGIFLMKQTISIFRWRNRAASINIKPHLEWMDDHDNDENDDDNDKNMDVIDEEKDDYIDEMDKHYKQTQVNNRGISIDPEEMNIATK